MSCFTAIYTFWIQVQNRLDPIPIPKMCYPPPLLQQLKSLLFQLKGLREKQANNEILTPEEEKILRDAAN